MELGSFLLLKDLSKMNSNFTQISIPQPSQRVSTGNTTLTKIKYSPSKVYNPIKSDMTYNYVISKPMVAVIAIIYIDIYI